MFREAGIRGYLAALGQSVGAGAIRRHRLGRTYLDNEARSWLPDSARLRRVPSFRRAHATPAYLATIAAEGRGQREHRCLTNEALR